MPNRGPEVTRAVRDLRPFAFEMFQKSCARLRQHSRVSQQHGPTTGIDASIVQGEVKVSAFRRVDLSFCSFHELVVGRYRQEPYRFLVRERAACHQSDLEIVPRESRSLRQVFPPIADEVD